MTQRLNRVDSAAASLANAQPSQLRDEREAAVQHEAATFGMIIGAFVWFAIAAGLAMLGQLFAMWIVMIGIAIPFAATMWYAGRRSVGHAIRVPTFPGASRRRKVIIVSAVLLIGAVQMCGVVYTILTGEALIAADLADFSAGPLLGLLMTLLVLTPMIYGNYKQRQAEQAPEAD